MNFVALVGGAADNIANHSFDNCLAGTGDNTLPSIIRIDIRVRRVIYDGAGVRILREWIGYLQRPGRIPRSLGRREDIITRKIDFRLFVEECAEEPTNALGRAFVLIELPQAPHKPIGADMTVLWKFVGEHRKESLTKLVQCRCGISIVRELAGFIKRTTNRGGRGGITGGRTKLWRYRCGRCRTFLF